MMDHRCVLNDLGLYRCSCGDVFQWATDLDAHLRLWDQKRIARRSKDAVEKGLASWAPILGLKETTIKYIFKGDKAGGVCVLKTQMFRDLGADRQAYNELPDGDAVYRQVVLGEEAIGWCDTCRGATTFKLENPDAAVVHAGACRNCGTPLDLRTRIRITDSAGAP